jgi:hypothetical protein
LPNAGLIGDSGQVDSRQWDERYAGAGFEWTTRPNQFVAAELADLPPGRALDLAAGEGRNSVWLAERGWRVTAVDFSRVGLNKGRKLGAACGCTALSTGTAPRRPPSTPWSAPYATHDRSAVRQPRGAGRASGPKSMAAILIYNKFESPNY